MFNIGLDVGGREKVDLVRLRLSEGARSGFPDGTARSNVPIDSALFSCPWNLIS
ncbi:hypothetical protein BH24ACT7_BH24ACT7_02500 [soil metagenome]